MTKPEKATNAMQKLHTRFSNISTRLDAISRGIILAVVLLLPLIIVPAVWLPFTMVKTGFLALGTLAALILWAIARLNEHKLEFPNTNILWVSLTVLAGYFVVAVLSDSVLHSLIGFGFERDTVLSMFTLVGILAAVTVTTKKIAHFMRLQKAALVSFVLLGLFQVVRITIGADVVLPGLFSSDPTATLLGSWNDLAVFSGLALLMSIAGLALFSSKKMVRGLLYAVMLIATFLLVVVNLSVVWATLALTTFVLAVYIFSDASYDRESGRFKPNVPFIRLIPSTFVLVISVVFLLAGNTIGERVSSAFDIAYVDVRPSWEGTMIVGTEVYKESAVLGVGPNSFSEAWVDHKPVGVNETNFWNSDFLFGVGVIPTAFITGGLVLGVLWLLFLAAFMHLGFRILARKIANPAHMYIATSSFIGAAYLWILAIVYVPQTVMLAYTFILTGVAIAAAQMAGVVRTREINAKNSYTSGIILTGVLLAVAITSFGVLGVNVERIVASAKLSRAIASVNGGDLVTAEYIANRLSLFENDARGAQLRANIGVLQLTNILNEESDDVEEQRTRFQQAISKTISAAQEATVTNKNDYQSWLLLADIYARLAPLNVDGAYDRAVESYEEARKRNQKNPGIPMQLARLALGEDDLEGARVYAKQALDLKSNYTDAYYLLSQISIREGDVTNAIRETESAVLLRPGNAGLLFQLGTLHYGNRAYEKVIPVLERAIAINPDYSNALYFLGLSYDVTKNSEGALATFERIAALNPENEEVQSIVTAITSGGSAFDVLGGIPKIAELDELPVSDEN